ncbi:hypothetical protein GCK32_008161 [Trichostrongylus colubriformis]|uniref:Uncharacterized protein n=1 Tax=Trichostrongylus colubriformis TaxID=6319 RepID=A0AAN8FDS3_TRICO
MDICGRADTSSKNSEFVSTTSTPATKLLIPGRAGLGVAPLPPLRMSHCAPRSRHAPDKTTRMSSPYLLQHHRHNRRYHHLHPHHLFLLTHYCRLVLFLLVAELLAWPTVSGAPDSYYYDDGPRSHPRHRRPEYQPRMVCNNGTDYACICRASIPPDDEPTPGIIECDEFIQSLELPVVDMRLRHVNLEAHLHTNEKYETYFKRRIANIVSSYCEHQANECPGATLRITQAPSDASQSDDSDDDRSVLYAADDESEPLLTQNNVVLLRVEREPVNVTRILFAITKSENVGSLNEQMIIDPVKVKYILGSQAGPLARILGGIKLDSVRVSRIRRHLKASDTDNTRLITIISVVGAFFAICYIIGAIRLCRDARRRKRERKAKEDPNGLGNATLVPNYGSCQRKSSKNGGVLKMTGCERNAIPSNYKEIDECVDNYHPDEPHVLTERQARFMFMCDPSQLPREPTFDSQTAVDVEPIHSVKSTPPREEVVVKNEISVMTAAVAAEKRRSSSSSQELQPPPSKTTNRSPVSDPEVPALVLVPSLSLDSPITSDDSPNSAAPITLLGNDRESPIDRPKSRRGSRIGDEVLDLREEDGPLDVEKNNNYNLLFENLANVRDGDENDRRAQLERWSSSDGEVDVYYKLSEDEDTIHGDDWANAKVAGVAGAQPQHEVTDSDSDEDDDAGELLKRNDGDIDGYVYERLREELTPVPFDS